MGQKVSCEIGLLIHLVIINGRPITIFHLLTKNVMILVLRALHIFKFHLPMAISVDWDSDR